MRWRLKHWAYEQKVGVSYHEKTDLLLAGKVKEIIDENVKAPHNCDWTVTIHVIANEYLEWMLLLLNSEYGAMKKTLKLNRLLAKVWASRHKIYLNAILTNVIEKLCKNKNLRCWFKATLALETRIGCICNTHGYQRGICDGLEMKLTLPLGGIQRAVTLNIAANSVTPLVFTCVHWWLQKVRYKFLFD